MVEQPTKQEEVNQQEETKQPSAQQPIKSETTTPQSPPVTLEQSIDQSPPVQMSEAEKQAREALKDIWSKELGEDTTNAPEGTGKNQAGELDDLISSLSKEDLIKHLTDFAHEKDDEDLQALLKAQFLNIIKEKAPNSISPEEETYFNQRSAEFVGKVAMVADNPIAFNWALDSAKVAQQAGLDITSESTTSNLTEEQIQEIAGSEEGKVLKNRLAEMTSSMLDALYEMHKGSSMELFIKALFMGADLFSSSASGLDFSDEENNKDTYADKKKFTAELGNQGDDSKKTQFAQKFWLAYSDERGMKEVLDLNSHQRTLLETNCADPTPARVHQVLILLVDQLFKGGADNMKRKWDNVKISLGNRLFQPPLTLNRSVYEYLYRIHEGIEDFGECFRKEDRLSASQ